MATENNPRPDAERPLRILLVASIVLPILIFSGVSWIAYGQYFEDAQRRLESTAGEVYEHAAKVFETFELAQRYTDELFDDVADPRILAGEAQYHGRLKAIVDMLPQLRDILMIDRDGHPLVSATFFPAEHHLDLSDRDYFATLKDDATKTSFLSGLFESRLADRRLFVISRRRALNGSSGFEGVITTGIAPEYFMDYYARLPIDQGGAFALMRSDGVELARYPQRQEEPPQPGQTLFGQAVKSAPDQGSVIAVSPVDGVERMLTYRRLPRQDVYVVVAVPTSTIVHNWMLGMGRHLFFGIPATITMVALAWVALIRTRRASVAHAQLHEEVARRESTEQALRQAQKMEAIGRLTGGIAHDFNNLLTAILGNIDLAVNRLGNVEERVSRNLASAREASRRAATLVNRLLSFSRQHPLEVKVIDINRLVQSMSDLLRRAIGETVTVETVLAGGLWRAAVDPNQLENAILNLAVNARDAMGDGGKLTIETANTYLDEAYASAHAQEVVAGQYVMLAVTDTGGGMSKDVLERVFEPFFTTKPPGVGTGLGLSMVYGFVKQSGGHVKIYSEVGEGTTVKLYFPRSREAETAHTTGEDAVVVTLASPEQPSETILLVEDDEEVSRFATEVLRESGYRVVAAHNAAEGLRALEREPGIALLFTDVVLPGGMNGRQLADEACRRHAHLKVLYATGYTRNAIIHQGRLDANVELLTKPFTYDTLVRKVRQVLDAGGAAGRRKEPQAI